MVELKLHGVCGGGGGGVLCMQGHQVTLSIKMLTELVKVNLYMIMPAIGMSLLKESSAHPSFPYLVTWPSSM